MESLKTCRSCMFICPPGLAGGTRVGRCTPVPAPHTIAFMREHAESALGDVRRSLFSPLECFVVAQLVSVIVGYTSGTLSW